MVRKIVKEAIIKKAEALNNSRPLDVWKISEYPEVKKALKQIFEEMQAEGLVNERYKKSLKKHIQTIALDLYVAHITDPTLYVAYSRSSSSYDQNSRYNSLFLGYRNVIKTTDFLIKNKYIENTMGYNGENKSRLSRMRATGKLIGQILGKHKVVQSMIKRDEDEELIILKDINKKKLEYDDTEETNRMRENLKLINENLEKHVILPYVTDDELSEINERLKKDPDKTPIDVTQKRLRRIFNNGSFQQGGRFYDGWWQSIPKEYRKQIKMNGSYTAEIDYSGLHIHMLYAQKGLQLEDTDPYQLDGYADIRKFLKMVLLISVNADSKIKAKRAITDAINKGDIEKPKSIKSIDDVIDDFVKKHAAIKESFFSGAGLELQFLDSQLAEKVMISFASKGYPILPIHDSFIVETEKKEILDWCMADAYYDIFKMKCPVSINELGRQEKQEDWNRIFESAQRVIKTEEIIKIDKKDFTTEFISSLKIDEKEVNKEIRKFEIEFREKEKSYSWYRAMEKK